MKSSAAGLHDVDDMLVKESPRYAVSVAVVLIAACLPQQAPQVLGNPILFVMCSDVHGSTSPGEHINTRPKFTHTIRRLPV